MQTIADLWAGESLFYLDPHQVASTVDMSHVPFEPTFIVDIEPVWERKREAILAYATQLERAGDDDEGKHLLYGADILERVETKARTYGERIRCRYGEPLLAPEPVALDSPLIRWLGPGR